MTYEANRGGISSPTTQQEAMMARKAKNQFPPGWDEDSVRDVLDHYEHQTEDEAVAEDEAAFAQSTMMAVPSSLVPRVRQLIAEHRRKRAS